MQTALKQFSQPAEDVVVPEEELAARYEVRPSFMSDMELDVYRLLIEAVGDRAIICPKPRVFAALRVLDAAAHLEDALRIDRKHIDFLLADPNSGRPLCAVQIDVWDSDLQGYRLRETLLEEAFRRARFPVAYLLSNHLPSANQLASTIDDLLAASAREHGGATHDAHDAVTMPKRAHANDASVQQHAHNKEAGVQPRQWQINP